MWKKVDDFIKEQNMFAAEDVVIAGVSGGADSMCLLCVLDEWREKLGFQLVVVHVNHGLRDAADEEEAYVKAECRRRNLPFEAYHVNIREVAENEKCSEEEAGRIFRRKAFEETAFKYQGTKIALAHHKNDNAETFLFQLARGSRLKGLGGMKPVNGRYVRPFLGVCREEIEEYLEERNVRYYIDESNATDAYSRNRIRNHVIPYLREQVNEQVVEHINQSMEYLRLVQEYLEKQVAMLWEKTVTELPDGRKIISSEIMKEERLIREMLLKRALAETAGAEKDIGEKHVKALDGLLEKQCGKSLDLPYQIQAVRMYGGIELRRRAEQMEAAQEVLALNLEFGEKQEWFYKNYRIETHVFDKTEETGTIPKKTFTKWFDYDIINENVCIRTRMPGDRIAIDKEGNSQKIKNFFVNEKIPAEERERIPLLAEGNQILWIVGYRQSKVYQVSEQTKRILEITISGGN